MPYRVYADRQAYNAKIKCEIIDILIQSLKNTFIDIYYL